MRTKSFKRVFLTLMIMVVLVTAIFGSGFKKANASDTNSFDNTNVMEDLRSSQNFNIFDYPAYKSTNPEIYIMNVVEYCYSVDENNRENYGLYLYLYNPNGIEIDMGNNVNYVQIAVGYNNDGTPNDYEKFGLKFCSKSEEKYYENLFYKFKVNDHESSDGKTILQRVNSYQRRYDISGIEILEKGQTIHKEYGVGGCYTFKGYAKGYGADKKAESTLTCEVTNLETISLKTYSTYYRTGEYKENHRHDLTSVYFSVPDRYFDTYGNLQKIKATWYEYETTPVCVTSNQEVYDLLNPYLGKSTLETQDNFLQLYTGYQEMIGSSGHYDQYDWAYNCNYTNAVKEPCDRIAFLFSTNGEKISNYVVSSNLLRLYAVCYENSFETGYINVPGKQISHDLFEKTLSEKRASVNYVGDDVHHKLVEFDTDNTFDMLSYDDTHTGWQKFFAGLFGLAPNDVDVSYKGVSPIKVVTEEDMGNSNLARHLLIDGESSSLNSFKTFYNQAKAKNEKVVLFRFAQTDYVNLPVMAYNNAKGENLSGDYGRDTYIVKESVFFNFDVIQLTFNKAGAYTVIPAVSSPIDVYNAITIPDNGGLAWWEIVLAIILAIILLILIWPAIPFLIKLIWWLICLPFKGLILLFKSIVKKIKHRKGNKEE